MTTWKDLRIACVFAAVAGLAAPAAQAQINLGSLRGKVTDEQRFPMANASVEIADIDGGVRRTARIEAGGVFVFPALPPGEYRLTVSAEGFQSKQLKLRV